MKKELRQVLIAVDKHGSDNVKITDFTNNTEVITSIDTLKDVISSKEHRWFPSKKWGKYCVITEDHWEYAVKKVLYWEWFAPNYELFTDEKSVPIEAIL